MFKLNVLVAVSLLASVVFSGCAEDETNVLLASGAQTDVFEEGDSGIPFPESDTVGGGTTKTEDTVENDAVEGSEGGTDTAEPAEDTVETCVPDCVGKQCGSDGCGGSCGQCQSGTCEADGQCSCTPKCNGKTCGPDGCGGVCGTCKVGAECNALGQCVEDCNETCLSLDAQCGSVCGKDCGSCPLGEACTNYQCVCAPNCEGKVCGDDGCGGSCGTCEDNGACNAAGQCTGCIPNCDGKECGDDGCGGICGPGCGLGETCEEESGKCISTTCCYTNDAPGCNVPEIEECVCLTNPNCCAEGGSWSSLCVLAATLICDATCTTESPEEACQGYCGAQSPQGCWCDEGCVLNGDCCQDACDSCGACEEVDPPSSSCAGICGGTAPSGCSCEAGCAEAGNCCADACDECGECVAVPTNSCEGKCGVPFTAGLECQCDSGCVARGDCCTDTCDLCGFCPGLPADLTCEGNCGNGAVTSGELTCSCAADCLANDTCCPDAADFCELDVPAGCAGSCGGKAPSGCWCDSSCVPFGDCCEDACSLCGACPVVEESDSCVGNCDGVAESGCSCSADCYLSGTCCPNVATACDYADNSCQGNCGEVTASGCSCDEGCHVAGNCCEDVAEVCGFDDNSCEGDCDGITASGCWCDALCTTYGDCCSDACDVCGQCDEAENVCGTAGACSAGDVDVKECGFCGYQTRTCDNNCVWGAWSSCVGSGECAAGTKEACDTGCGVKTCLNSCSYGGCAPTYDPYEYNNVKSLAHSFQSEPLAEGTTLTTTEQAWIHSATDVDWYKVDVVESGGLDWSLVLEASLAGGESGLREICLIYDRKSDGTTDFQKCTAGSENVLNVSLGNIDNVGANDDGTLYIKVTGKEGCAGYDLLVSVD